MLNNLRANLPHSPCGTNEFGEILDWDNKVLPIVEINGKQMVELYWIYGRMYYDAAVIILVAYGRVELPLDLYSEVEPLFKDGDCKNIFLSNLTYRFKSGPLACKEYPGFVYIPFFTKYVINAEGIVISLLRGKEMSFFTAPPQPQKKKTAGYKYTRLLTSNGETKLGAMHRLLCYAFKRYEANVMQLVVNHIDGNPTNNKLGNLELVTILENSQHARATGLCTSSIPFLIKNLKTGDIKRYTTRAECLEDIGRTNLGFVSYRLRIRYDTIPEDGLIFKYDDGSAWPVINSTETAPMVDLNSRKIAARNIFTGDIVVFNGTLSGFDLTGVKAATIYAHVEHNKTVPYNGYNFRYFERDIKWPVHCSRRLAIYKEFPIYPGDGVIVTNELTGEEKFYTSKIAAGKAHDVDDASILFYINQNKLINDRYRFKLFPFKDRNGPPNQ